MRNAAVKQKEEFDFLRERNKILDDLRHGSLLARESGAAPTAQLVVWLLSQESMQICARIGDKEHKWIYGSDKSHMPAFFRSWAERWDTKISRLVDPKMRIEDVDDPTKIVRLEPTDNEFDRMYRVVSWSRFMASSLSR